jgi:hypothetical protein
MKQKPLLALSGIQPWFDAILKWGKDIENRKWPTPYRGTIALHTSKKIPPDEYWAAREMIEKVSGPGVLVPSSEDLVKGCIIGLVDIVDCVTKSDSPWFFGPFGFVLQNPRVLVKPIPAKGALNFWTVPDDIRAQIEEQLKQ